MAKNGQGSPCPFFTLILTKKLKLMHWENKMNRIKTLITVIVLAVCLVSSNIYVAAALGENEMPFLPFDTEGQKDESLENNQADNSTSSGSSSDSGSSYRPSTKPDDKTETQQDSTQTENNIKTFSDVTENDWFYSDVMYICTKGIMNGVSESSFAPNDKVTRAMFITLLYRCSKETSGKSIPFTDVEKGSWYEKATIWGFEKGIVNGTGNGKFSPDSILTREQLAVMLYNFKKSSQNKKSADLTIFLDSDEVSPWATEAMMWAVENKIIGGRANSTLAPKESATRAEAAIVMRRLEKI